MYIRNYPTGRACAVGTTISIPVPSRTGTVVPHSRCVLDLYDVDAPRAPSAHTTNSASRRFTVRARSRPRGANTLVSFPGLRSD